MKIALLTITIVLYSIILVAQLPTQIPDNPAELEQANSIIAAEFAPEIRQLVEDKYANSASGRADLIVPLNYNGWDVGQNWDDLPYADISQLVPKVYYSVVWTSHAWIVTYALYHARDYAMAEGACCDGVTIDGVLAIPGDNHEHDLEGAIFVIDRTAANFGNVIGGFSTFHNTLEHYYDVTTTPIVFCDNQTHAIELNLSPSDDISDWENVCDDGSHVGSTANQVVYNLSPTNTPTLGNLTRSTENENFLTGTGEYVLEDIFSSSLFSLGNLRDYGSVFNGDEIFHEDSGGCEDNGSPAKAPWGWSQLDYSNFSIRKLICLSIYESDSDLTCVTDYAQVDQIESTDDIPFLIEHNPYFDGTDCSEEGESLVVSESGIFDHPNGIAWKEIKVSAGSNLTIKDDFIKMSTDGKIIVESGGQLTIENTTITSCTDSPDHIWDGIFIAGPNTEVKIMNNSMIRHTASGIKNFDGNYNNAGNDVNLLIDNSMFSQNEYNLRINGKSADCDITIVNSNFSFGGVCHLYDVDQGNVLFIDNEFADNHDAIILLDSDNEEIILNSNSFISNDVGIYFIDVVGASVVSNTFDGQGSTYVSSPEGIILYDSRVSIVNNNRFQRLETGIEVFGTAPMQAGIEVGHEDAPPNIFESNAFHIDFSGSDFPTGANVINNTFGNGLTDAIVAVYEQGAYLGDIVNNTFKKNQSSVYANASGNNPNFTQCNEFQSGLIQDLAYNADNSRTMFLENDFDSPDNIEANVQLYGVTTIAAQGQPTNAAGNCFTESLTNSIALEETANSFDYYYFNQGETCQIPTDFSGSLNDNLIIAFDLQPRCDGIGSGLNDPTGTGGDPTSQEPPTGDPTLYYCTSCIKDSIQHWVDVVIQTGGDDPTTPLVDPVTPPPTPVGTDGPSTNSQYAEVMLDQWVNYALFVAIDSDDYAFGEEVLSTLKSWKWSIKLYGLALLEKDYTKASIVLGTLPQDDTEQIAFHTVQNINLKRLTQATVLDPYIPTELEKTDLFDIGTSDHICSGYARGLYKVLTGITIPPYIKTPSTKNSSTPRSGKELDQYFTVFPNPLKDVLNLVKLEYNKSYAYEIVDLVGKGLLSGEINESVNAKIDVASLKQGLYHIVLQPSQGEVQVIRFVVQ